MTTKPETDRESLRNFIDSVERIAFSMAPPNEYTPRLVGLCQEARTIFLASPQESQQGSEGVKELKVYSVGHDGFYEGVRAGGYQMVMLQDHLAAMRARVSSGWKLVPVKPTDEMVPDYAHAGFAKQLYRDMLAAAPTPPGATNDE